MEVWRTDVTDVDREKAIEDEYGVLYSPDGLRLIKANRNLTTYRIKEGTKVICDEAFLWCESLAKIHVPKSVISIGVNPFIGCKQITITCNSPYFYTVDGILLSNHGELITCFSNQAHIAIPNSVTSIGSDAFRECESMVEIHIPDSVTSIGDAAFLQCISLNKIHLPDSVITIGNSTFCECISLTEIRIPDSITSIGENVFLKCNSLTSVYLPDSVTSIGDAAFFQCVSLRKIHLSNSVVSIGNAAFSGCLSLTEIHIPNSVTSIGEDVFSRCSSLSSIYIPKGTIGRFEEQLLDLDLILKLVEY